MANNKLLRFGSRGSDVKTLQEQLNQNGFSLATDGIFGQKTLDAVKRFQQKNNLSVDGIVGNLTNSALRKGTVKKVQGEPKTEEKDVGFTYGAFTESDGTKGLGTKATTASDAVSNYGDFAYTNQNALNEALQKYLNREDFSYDLNADALYQQYKDKYIQQGKMAMADTIGQASAMTGGYGNSYAATVGNQAYQAHLQQLNDIVPELYQMAYDRYNQEGQDLLNQYSLLTDDRNAEYGMWSDKYNRLVADRDYYANQYNNARSWDYGLYSDDKSYAYQNHRDAITDSQWETEFNEAKRQYDEQMAFNKQQYEDSKFVSGGGGYESSLDENNNPVVKPTVGNTGSTSKITSEIEKQASEFTSNDALSNWAYGLADNGIISVDDADQLVAKYMNYNGVRKDDDGNYRSATYKEMVESTDGWTVLDDGGGNLFGIDKDARVQAPNGEQLSLKQLRDKLVDDEEMSTSKANDKIKELQQNLGISENWLFGW